MISLYVGETQFDLGTASEYNNFLNYISTIGDHSSILDHSPCHGGYLFEGDAYDMEIGLYTGSVKRLHKELLDILNKWRAIEPAIKLVLYEMLIATCTALDEQKDISFDDGAYFGLGK